MALRHVQRTYDRLGEEDPLYAVLSFPEARGNRWDPEVFFARGRSEIDAVMADLVRRDLALNPGRALDFGCGVGRLTQALCAHFEEAVGVDISRSMVERAKQFNRHGERCRYLVNTRDDLALLEDGAFDFVYSNITLQHIPPEASTRYVAEFHRVLKPNGLALFQLPSGPRHDPGSFGARWYALRHGPLRRAWKRLRGKAPVEIHYVNEGRVRDIVRESGGELLDSWHEGSVRGARVSMWYLARRVSA